MQEIKACVLNFVAATLLWASFKGMVSIDLVNILAGVLFGVRSGDLIDTVTTRTKTTEVCVRTKVIPVGVSLGALKVHIIFTILLSSTCFFQGGSWTMTGIMYAASFLMYVWYAMVVEGIRVAIRKTI